jgi:hypothetical protein
MCLHLRFRQHAGKSTGELALAHRSMEEILVQDMIFVAATIFFFAIAILYIRGCERLK